MHAQKLGIDNLSVMSRAEAGDSITACAKAIQSISQTRSNIGAYINRLEHTIKNLDNTAENTQAAESAIRDTDIAYEMVAYSKGNILAQAGEAMLSQAMDIGESALALLKIG